ncbi:hypothetical protein KXW98_004222 [Aspergillus fumigatus]|uniref:DUF614 domain protein n=3 Tax=Aspergillus fumigatus TaxID=746128 RepID=Q4WS31_ASPFU|nr:DUF614 domain protein [Aspergillus fumigatus Af293]EDP56656.1 DUF614 domain protein [Aspergillus fumigatus A1163]KAF4261990.1 hypothetical protein CNMCM8714_000333 [Aspergillus fumigatus]KMK62563.1 hypothetical protein Y699_04946 [Aspergillus fumigatus Z5]EAL90751.1 DUF614 domain protein [Aspergillus fumigatus Af293]KAF4270594.1 hypothetical protein CNMCM8812_001059 [Aspergillus fumigatus]
MDTKSPEQPAPAAPHAHEWSSSFWDCFSPTETCLIGWCAPCCLFGKTQSRLQDPALKEHQYVNGDCCLYALSSYCGLYWVLLMIKRGQLRERFGIQGSTFQDCWQSYLCPCCTLVQNEKEVEARFSNTTQVGYQPPSGMAYPQ